MRALFAVPISALVLLSAAATVARAQQAPDVVPTVPDFLAGDVSSGPADPGAPQAKAPLKIAYTADAGLALRTGTGGSVAVGGSVSVTKGDPATNGVTYTATANALLGSTANTSTTFPTQTITTGPSGEPIINNGSKTIKSGPGILPAGEFGVSASGRADQGGALGMAADALAHVIDPSGKQNIQKTWTAGIDVDRDLMVNRTFRANAEAGLVLTHGDVNHGNSWTLEPTVATGVGVIGTQALPYLVAGAKGQYTYCPVQSKSGSDEFCLAGSGTALAGVFQAEVQAGGTAEWRHKIADESSNKWIHQLVVGAGGGGEVDANLAGVQAGAQTGFAITIH